MICDMAKTHINTYFAVVVLKMMQFYIVDGLFHTVIHGIITVTS